MMGELLELDRTHGWVTFHGERQVTSPEGKPMWDVGPFHDKLKNVKVLEGTGRFDKRGVELFEGDAYVYDDGKVAVVEWKVDKSGWSGFFIHEGAEIIGSTIENPRLVETFKELHADQTPY